MIFSDFFDAGTQKNLEFFTIPISPQTRQIRPSITHIRKKMNVEICTECLPRRDAKQPSSMGGLLCAWIFRNSAG